MVHRTEIEKIALYDRASARKELSFVSSGKAGQVYNNIPTSKAPATAKEKGVVISAAPCATEMVLERLAKACDEEIVTGCARETAGAADLGALDTPAAPDLGAFVTPVVQL